MSIKLLNRVAAALAAALIAAPCLAADKTTDEDEATDEKPYIEEIIVTATLRETNLMDTPIAITVLDEKALIDKGIFDVRDLFLAVPGMSYTVSVPFSGDRRSSYSIFPSLSWRIASSHC